MINEETTKAIYEVNQRRANYLVDRLSRDLVSDKPLETILEVPPENVYHFARTLHKEPLELLG